LVAIASMNPAERARKSNDAQVLTMGARVIAPQAAEVVLEHWLASEFEGGRSAGLTEEACIRTSRWSCRGGGGRG
jgi:ribose 5-phosphate isomerase RpiB